MKSVRCIVWCVVGVLVLSSGASAGTLTGSYSSIPSNSVVNLSAIGIVDWVHWGLYTATSLNRKAGVTPRIGNFTVAYDTENTNAFANVFQFSDNYNGYSWSDGTPEPRVTNSTTGVWCYGIPTIGTGFEFTVPADTTTRTLKVYVGAFAARGRFEATLSDGSAPAYLNTTFANLMGNGPSAVFTLNYAADSAGQTLRIRWTVLLGFRPDANVTLQAAAMTATGANNPPSVSLTGPADSSIYAAPASVTLTATATDFDGTVDRVEFFAGNQKLGQDTIAPYSFNWSSVQPGLHVLKALAYDNGGEVGESRPVEIFVHGTGGSISGSVSDPPFSLDLTTEGSADWAHWGLVSSTSYNHKAGVSQQIGNFTRIGDNPVQRYDDNYTGYMWSDGTPVASVPTNSYTGVFVIGEDHGFALALPAGTTPRTVKIYAGLYGAVGKFQAWLSDFSAPAYVDMSLDNVFGSSYAVYTLTYTAASASKTLHIRYRPKLLYDGQFGNVTLQAATLVGPGGGNIAPTVSITNPPNNATFTAPANVSIQANASDADGTIAKVEFFEGATKLGEATASPYTFNWNNVPAGTYTLTARATDDDAASTTSAPVSITVGQSSNAPPTVTLTNPPNNAVFTAPAQIVLQAAATDSDGVVAAVEFYNGATRLGEDTAAPYEFNWTGVSAGTYTLRARAIDNGGALTDSDPVAVVVRNPLGTITLRNVTISSGKCRFSLPTEPHWTYTVEAAGSLNGTDWETIRTIQGSGAEVTIEDDLSGRTSRFYRVLAR